MVKANSSGEDPRATGGLAFFFWFVVVCSAGHLHRLSNLRGRKFTIVLRSGTDSWVLSGYLGVRHPLSPVIRLGLQTPRKKEKSLSHGCGGGV